MSFNPLKAQIELACAGAPVLLPEPEKATPGVPGGPATSPAKAAPALRPATTAAQIAAANVFRIMCLPVWTPPWRRPQKSSLIWPTKRRQPRAVTIGVAISSSFRKSSFESLPRRPGRTWRPSATSLLRHPSFEVKRAAAADEVQSETGHCAGRPCRRGTVPCRPVSSFFQTRPVTTPERPSLPSFALALNRRIVDDANGVCGHADPTL